VPSQAGRCGLTGSAEDAGAGRVPVDVGAGVNALGDGVAPASPGFGALAAGELGGAVGPAAGSSTPHAATASAVAPRTA
jgi:hypothetical protein